MKRKRKEISFQTLYHNLVQHIIPVLLVTNCMDVIIRSININVFCYIGDILVFRVASSDTNKSLWKYITHEQFEED